MPGSSLAVPTPMDRFGPLMREVQLRRLFGDGKAFADAVPIRPTRDIMAAFATVRRDDEALRAFVADHFHMPASAITGEGARDGNLRDHIRSLWPELTRCSSGAPSEASLLSVDQPYIVPGGRFAELYYWDSYFSALGLVRDGYEPLARSIADAFTCLIEKYGHIPNGTRTYYLSRSQPPLYFALLDLLPTSDLSIRRRRLAAMVAEHAFWMCGVEQLAPREGIARVVMMPGGGVLNRYWDDRETPRDESYAEDCAIAARSAAPPGEVFRALRAGAESGWDFSSRWLAEAGDLATIRTQHIVPIDLNSFLYGLERAIARLAAELSARSLAKRFATAAMRRQVAIARWLWTDEGHFTDYDIAANTQRPAITAATAAPLFTGVATAEQANSVARAIKVSLLAPGGLRTTTVASGEQWDNPNGWAPLQWIAYSGLRRYGHDDLACDIAARWVRTVVAEFRCSGALHEKYDLESGGRGQGGEYVPQIGFGWTNGVTAAFIDELAADRRTAGRRRPVPTRNVT